jgi:hypothetical protein
VFRGKGFTTQLWFRVQCLGAGVESGVKIMCPQGFKVKGAGSKVEVWVSGS